MSQGLTRRISQSLLPTRRMGLLSTRRYLWFGSKEERAGLKPLSNEPPEDDKS